MSTRAATPAGRRRAKARTRPSSGGGRAPARKVTSKKRPSPTRRPAATRRSTRSAPRRPRPRSRSAHREGRRRIGPLGWRGRLVLAGVALTVLAGTYLLWFRDSSLVAITNVKVEGVTSENRDQVVAALTDSAEGMTTLHVRGDELAAVAGRFPTVASVSVDTDFPHGATIQVTERRPVLIARAGDREVPVAADGTLLGAMPAQAAHVPVIDVDQLPATGRLNDGALDEATVVGAAPGPLLAQVEKVRLDKALGVVLTMHGGVELRFGTSADAPAKWQAAAAVLADPKLTTLSYVDVRVPERPAVGGAGAPTDVATTVPPPPVATDPAATSTTPTVTSTTTPTAP